MNPTDSRELFTGTDTEREAARQIAEAELNRYPANEKGV